MKKSILCSFALLLAAACFLPASSAYASRNVFGIRGGFTDDPDTIFFGGHALIHPRRAPQLRLEPSLELGIGDDADLFTLRFNFNLKYLIPLGRRQAFYPLFGPGIYYFTFQDCDGCSGTDVGINLGVGFALYGLSFDLALGFPDDDLPDLTFTIGYSFW